MTTSQTAKLNRVMRDLDALAGSLEDAGFEGQAGLLDEAADKIEAVQEAFSAL